MPGDTLEVLWSLWVWEVKEFILQRKTWAECFQDNFVHIIQEDYVEQIKAEVCEPLCLQVWRVECVWERRNKLHEGNAKYAWGNVKETKRKFRLQGWERGLTPGQGILAQVTQISTPASREEKPK